MFGGEEYYLQIDCHMRFSKVEGEGWDKYLVSMIKICGSKSVLTCYPAGYKSDDDFAT